MGNSCSDSQIDPLKSRIAAHKRANPRHSLQRFPYSPHEIRNRCNNDRNRRNKSSLRQRKLESDAEDRCRHGSYRQNYSSLQLRKLESDAENRCLHDRSRRNHSPLHRFPSLGSKSRITARWRAFSGGQLAAIAKFTPSNQESLYAGGRFLAKTCSDSQVWA